MNECLRALLSGVIDYAGMFPPAALSWHAALENHRSNRHGSAAWLLGRFVCPAGRVPDLATQYQADRDGPLSIVVPATAEDSLDAFWQQLDTALAQLSHAAAIASTVDTLELGWPAELLRRPEPGAFKSFLQTVAAKVANAGLRHLTIFFELARAEGLTLSCRQAALAACATAVAEYNATALPQGLLAGMKFRTGGTQASNVPTAAELAAMMTVCCGSRVCWKATAGLHHPLRHVDPDLGVPVHGFLNVLVAAVMGHIHRLSVDELQAILEQRDLAHLALTGKLLQWGERTLTTEQIAAARQSSLRSFGSCSFIEPCHELRVLALL